MMMLVFVTEDGQSAHGTGPVAYVRHGPDATLPHHPRAMEWRYFATMDTDDAMVREERLQLLTALVQGKAYISKQLIAGRHLATSSRPIEATSPLG